MRLGTNFTERCWSHALNLDLRLHQIEGWMVAEPLGLSSGNTQTTH
jgi:hypothetical protein